MLMYKFEMSAYIEVALFSSSHCNAMDKRIYAGFISGDIKMLPDLP